MEITPKQNTHNIDAYVNHINDKNKVNPTPDKTNKTVAKTDTVEISDTAKRIREAKEQLEAIPDVQAEKVAVLKSQIENGTYDRKAEDIAEKMLKESLFNDLL